MVTRRWITAASSSRLRRPQHGLEDNPTRSAISATDSPASCWIRSRILASTASSVSGNLSSFPTGQGATFLPWNRSVGACFWQAIASFLYDLLTEVGRPKRKEFAMRHFDVTLDDKFLLTEGRVFITGVQALLRVLLDQHRLDAAAGLKTAGFVSGYRGSPLGGLDQQAHRSQTFLDAAGVVFKEGLN